MNEQNPNISLAEELKGIRIKEQKGFTNIISPAFCMVFTERNLKPIDLRLC
jgi:hypothetical protein